MSCSFQILLFCVFYLTIINSTALAHGVKVEKGVKKELKLAAITFLKEQWLKLLTPPPKEVKKRDLDSIPPVEKVLVPAPVHEVLEEYKQEIANPQENPQMFNYFMKIKENKPLGLYTNINMPAMEMKEAELKRAEFVNRFFGELPPPIIGSLPPIPAQDPFAYFVPLITPPPPPPPPPPTTPVPPPEIPPTEGPLVRGSRLALYLGKSFFKMMKQFVKNAKSEIKKMAVPSPAEPVPPPGPSKRR